MIDVAIANQQAALEIDEEKLRRAIEQVLAGEGCRAAAVSLAVVDDARIHELNRRFLSHDCPTDVLSFVLDRRDESLEGEVIVSAETAAREAGRFGWSAGDEMLLYVVHGALHLVGFDDQEPAAAGRMRAAEARYLAPFGLEPADHGREAAPPAAPLGSAMQEQGEATG